MIKNMFGSSYESEDNTDDLIFEKLICEKHDKGNYYSIQYLDLNDKKHTGFSSYSLDIVSDYIKNYFINEKSDTERYAHWYKITIPKDTASLLFKDVKHNVNFRKCSNCNVIGSLNDKYCPNCGCKMDEVSEK